MPAGDSYTLQVIGSVGKQYVENVLAFNLQVASTPDTPLKNAMDIVGGFVSTVQEPYLAMLPSDYILGGYKCRRIMSGGGGNTFSVVDGVSAGTFGEVSVTSGQAPLIVFPFAGTAEPHRTFNTAKLFIPAMSVGSVIGDIVQAAFIAAVNAFIAALVATITQGTNISAYGVVQRNSGRFSMLTIGSLSFTLGTQRRRLRPAI